MISISMDLLYLTTFFNSSSCQLQGRYHCKLQVFKCIRTEMCNSLSKRRLAHRRKQASAFIQTRLLNNFAILLEGVNINDIKKIIPIAYLPLFTKKY